MDSLRNFKDFLLIFNTISETCFNRCVNTFQVRDLTQEELRCVDQCSNKCIRVNHKVMGVYMEVQPVIMQKRMEEMEKQASSAALENTSVANIEPNGEVSPEVPSEVSDKKE